MWEFWRSKSAKAADAPGTRPRRTTESPISKLSAFVNFKDLKLGADDDDADSSEENEPEQRVPSLQPTPLQRRSSTLRRMPEKNKLIIILVGLPGRGKTFLCNKLKCYLNW